MFTETNINLTLVKGLGPEGLYYKSGGLWEVGPQNGWRWDVDPLIHPPTKSDTNIVSLFSDTVTYLERGDIC